MFDWVNRVNFAERILGEQKRKWIIYRRVITNQITGK